MAHILVIDDDQVVLMWLKRTLESNGYEVETVLDGNEAISKQHKIMADLIITDILMPGKDGLEIIAELRREFPEVKIIAMTGGGLIEAASYLNMAKAVGAQGAFSKDIDEEVLINIVREILP